MAGFALRLLLAIFGTAHAARHSSVANLDATVSGAAGSNATGPEELDSDSDVVDGVMVGGIWDLIDNSEYVLEWTESAEAWGFYEKVKDTESPKWYFITPLMCRASGIWYKLEIKHAATFYNCILVTCNLEGNVERIEPQNECYEYTSKVMRTRGPYVTRDSDWALFHIPYNTQLPAIDTSKAVDNGWTLDSMTVQRALQEHEPRHYYDFVNEGRRGKKYGWGLSKKCSEYRALWKEVDGLRFTTPASLETCKTKRVDVRKSCVSKYEAFVGTTAWAVKELIEKKELHNFESCRTWCEKNDCYNKDAPQDVKRDNKAVVAAMNSWKYACEQELDIVVANKMQACNAIGSVCDKPWAKFLPCAEAYSTPFFYNF